jgi:DNA-binding transcriptional regulator GbsR (MarR family)
MEQWGAVKKVWIKGDRKDYYTAVDWFGGIIKNAIVDTVGKKLSAYSSLIEDIQGELDSISGGDGDGQFIRDRVARLRNFQARAGKIWSNPLFEMFMK